MLLILLAVAPQPVLSEEAPGSPSFAAEAMPAPGRARTAMLSDYLPSLAGGPGDTPVFIIEGRKPGATLFVCAGTHGNEIAGVVAAAIIAEKAEVEQGRLIVLPRANRSAAFYPDPDKPGPPSIRIGTAKGERVFLYGARRTRPEDEGRPDPPLFLYPGSRLTQNGNEARNLDRNYPGRPDGGLTTRVAFAISSLIEKEGVDIALDLHESDPESKLAWIIVANPKNVDYAAMAVLDLEASGIRMAVDASAAEPRGLSHREWGDGGKAMAFLVETPNPAQAAPPGAGDAANDPGMPLSLRVSVQLATLAAIVSACDEGLPEGSRIVLEGIPAPRQVSASGLGAFLE
jgi:predicted deacylase